MEFLRFFVFEVIVTVKVVVARYWGQRIGDLRKGCRGFKSIGRIH